MQKRNPFVFFCFVGFYSKEAFHKFIPYSIDTGLTSNPPTSEILNIQIGGKCTCAMYCILSETCGVFSFSTQTGECRLY